MFTSKKTQYLNTNFDRISPITNVDSLYFEQAISVDNNIFKIYRQSVTKHMPIQLKAYNAGIGSSSEEYEYVKIYSDIENPSINTQIKKYEFNVFTSDNKAQYDTSLFEFNSSLCVGLCDVLNYYTPMSIWLQKYVDVSQHIDAFHEPLNVLDTKADILVNAAYELNHAFDDTQSYNYSDLVSPSTNHIYNLIYYPWEKNPLDFVENASMIVKIQGISCNISNNINISDYVSIDIPLRINNDNVEKWLIHYDYDSSTITYLKDEYGNEGSFDFRARKTNNNGLIANFNTNIKPNNNKFFFDPENSSVLLANTINLCSNNAIFDSSLVYLFESNNNLIKHSNNVSISGDNNKIFNSNGNVEIQGSSNIVINCENSSIFIYGSNNYLINLKNQNISVRNNNIIVGDSSSPYQENAAHQFNENNKLFFDMSVSTGTKYSLLNNGIIFGGTNNDISIYAKSFNTLQ